MRVVNFGLSFEAAIDCASVVGAGLSLYTYCMCVEAKQKMLDLTETN